MPMVYLSFLCECMCLWNIVSPMSCRTQSHLRNDTFVNYANPARYIIVNCALLRTALYRMIAEKKLACELIEIIPYVCTCIMVNY